MLYFFGKLKNHGKIIAVRVSSEQLEIQAFLRHENCGDLLCSCKMQSLLNACWGLGGGAWLSRLIGRCA